MSRLSIDQLLSAIMQDLSAGQAMAAGKKAVAGLQSFPNHPDLLHLAAISRQACGAPADAIPYFQQAIRLSPDFAAYRVNYADCLLGLGQWQEGVAILEEKPEIIAANGPAQTNLGQAHEMGGDYEKAGIAWKQALLLQPEEAVCYLNYARALEHNDGAAAAAGFLADAQQRFPGDIAIVITLAAALITAGEMKKAVQVLDAGRLQWPDIGEIWLNRAGALQKSGAYDAAKKDYKKAMTAQCLLDDTAIQARISLAMLELLTGNADAGWRLYEARLDLPFPQLRASDLPRWRGQDIADTTILVRGDQGFGDVLHMLRYMPVLLEKTGAQVVLEVPGALLGLLDVLLPDVTLIARNADIPVACQYQVSMMSLPLLLECNTPPVLGIKTDAIGKDPAFANHTGLVWQGSPTHLNDAYRSIPAAMLAPLSTTGGAFVSLQTGDDITLPFDMPVAAPFMKDFLASARIVKGLDRVITVDTAMAHLAGLFGKECWLLLPFDPDWRWGLDSTTTLLYPNMRLFRQPAPGDWGSVMDDLCIALKGGA